MWPFGKKAKQPEAKTVEEKPKPEPPSEVKLECPICKQTLEKYSKSRFKCPHCRNWIYFRDNRLMTRETYEKLREEYYERRYEESLREIFLEDLAKLGLNEEMFRRREQELLKKTGVTPKKNAVLRSLFNETILKIKDLNEMQERYHNLAIILNREGEETFNILQAAAKTRLAALKKEGFKKVYIVPSQNCEACKQWSGKIMTIEEALKSMPIPIRECKNYPYNENCPFCVCFYDPEYDEEYLMAKFRDSR